MRNYGYFESKTKPSSTRLIVSSERSQTSKEIQIMHMKIGLEKSRNSRFNSCNNQQV